MKKLNLLMLLSFLIISTAYAQPTTNFTGKKKEAPIRIAEPLKELREGEKLGFEVFWMGVPVGLGELEIQKKFDYNGVPAIRIVAVARTNEFLSKLYPVVDEVQTVVDAQNFRTLEFSKNVQEGRYRANEKMVYDYEKKKIFYESFHNKSKKEYPLEADVKDMVSAFFWFRLQPIKVGERVRTVINDEDTNRDLEVRVLQTEHKELRGNRVVETVLVEPKTSYKGIFEKRGRAWVHFTADERRIPVWIRLSTPYGPVIGVLKSEF